MSDLEPELVERMADLIRKLSHGFHLHGVNDAGISQYDAVAIAQGIASHLPDPDIAEARRVVAENYGSTRMQDGSRCLGDGPARVEEIKAGKGDKYWEMRVVIAAIKRGRELQKEGK